VANPTDPLASGASTPEGKLSIFGAIAGVVLALLAALEPLFRQASDMNPNNVWFRLALAVAGIALTTSSTWSFTKSQTLQKGGLLEILQASATTLAPMVGAVVLKKYLDHTANPTQAAAVTAVAAQLQRPPGTVMASAVPLSSSAPTPALGTPIPRP